MATRIFEYSKSINEETRWDILKDERDDNVYPIIAKGNIYQGILAQW